MSTNREALIYNLANGGKERNEGGTSHKNQEPITAPDRAVAQRSCRENDNFKKEKEQNRNNSNNRQSLVSITGVKKGKSPGGEYSHIWAI